MELGQAHPTLGSLLTQTSLLQVLLSVPFFSDGDGKGKAPSWNEPLNRNESWNRDPMWVAEDQAGRLRAWDRVGPGRAYPVGGAIGDTPTLFPKPPHIACEQGPDLPVVFVAFRVA